MRYQIATLAIALTLSATTVARADGGNENDEAPRRSESKVQLGPRPFFAMSSHSRSASTTSSTGFSTNRPTADRLSSSMMRTSSLTC